MVARFSGVILNVTTSPIVSSLLGGSEETALGEGATLLRLVAWPPGVGPLGATGPAFVARGPTSLVWPTIASSAAICTVSTSCLVTRLRSRSHRLQRPPE